MIAEVVADMMTAVAETDMMIAEVGADMMTAVAETDTMIVVVGADMMTVMMTVEVEADMMMTGEKAATHAEQEFNDLTYSPDTGTGALFISNQTFHRTTNESTPKYLKTKRENVTMLKRKRTHRCDVFLHIF